jgi:hypothetical protein
MSLARLTRLPAANEFAGGNWSYGISHSALAALRDEWVGPYNWIAEQATLNGSVSSGHVGNHGER